MKIYRVSLALLLFSLGACTGTRPTNLGLYDGKFLPCPEKPNCVSSFAATQDTEHYIAPLQVTGQTDQAMQKLKAILTGIDRVAIIEDNGLYLYAQFTSKLLRFVDDTEFFLDEQAKVIQVRSASRIGRKDFGVNRDRIESIRTQFQTP